MDPHLLDHEGAAFVLVGAGHRASRGHAHTAPDATAAAILRRLKLSEREAPIRPLVKGEWL